LTLLDPALALEGGSKAILYASLLVVLGASATRWLLIPRVKAELEAHGVRAMERSAARVALAASSLALAALVLRMWTHTVAVFGLHDAQSREALTIIAFQSRWGKGWEIQAIMGVVLLVSSAATVWRANLWPLATFAAVGFTAAMPLLGHAAGDVVRMAVDALHILAAGAWLGTLATVLLIPVPRTQDPAWRIRLLILRRFAPIALPSAAAVVAAGLVASWFYVGAISNLWTTSYGRILVLKAGLVAGVALCGYLNWSRLRKLHLESASPSIVLLEAALAAAVVTVTGYLTEVGHP
jgi:putative copper resistance protein D